MKEFALKHPFMTFFLITSAITGVVDIAKLVTIAVTGVDLTKTGKNVKEKVEEETTDECKPDIQ